MKNKYLRYVDKHISRSYFESKNVFITGGNSGVGFELAKYCAYLGSNVFLLCRSKEKADKAIKEIKELYPTSNVDFIPLDLADLNSIKECANMVKKYDVNMFVNNAGVFRLPKGETKDGFEITMGTNFIGVYYLNYLLMPYFKSLNHKVNVEIMSSIAAKLTKIDFDDFFSLTKYKKFKVYARSKLALNSIFDKYVEENNENINLILTHPGITYTPLILKAYKNKVFHAIARGFMKVAFHSASKAALSALKGLSLDKTNKIGPRGIFGISGYPGKWIIRKYKKSDKVIEVANSLLNIK